MQSRFSTRAGGTLCFRGARAGFALGRRTALGACSVWVGSGQRFYKAMGFERRHAAHVWVKVL